MVHQYTDEEIRDKVENALGMLFKNDSFLLENDVHERTIAHKLAEYLQRLFPDWNVDCEYNKIVTEKIEIKRIDTKKIYPDIIIHKRGKPDNLLVIEVKRTKRNEKGDITKLEKLTSLPGYKYKLGPLFALIKPSLT